MAEPQGFTAPTSQALLQEFRLANHNDRGQDNVQMVPVRHGIAYVVEEELRDATFDRSVNESIQSVALGLTQDGDITSSYVRLSTTNRASLPYDTQTLIAHNDGRVIIASRTSEGAAVEMDITQAAADAGITAAGIRRTQADIATDGEVDRTEQQTIIDLINRSKDVAHIR